MISGIYIALSGAKLQELKLEITANNLANVNTVGYKADKVTARPFEVELENAMGEFENMGIQQQQEDTPYYVAYAKTNQVGTSFAQGPTQQTGNPLNVALEGPGFIAVDTPSGVRYTRQGSFEIKSDGKLVTPDGYQVRGKGLANLGSGEITIDANGNVSIIGNGEANGQLQGTIEMKEFDDPSILRKEGHNLFACPNESLAKNSVSTSVRQGYVEMPNVNTVTEMVNLIELNRTFESYQKAITTIDESTQKLVSEVGGAV
ncbi:MAG: flagellar basal-body rod protein FlgF [Pseudomonadota bacterium]